jgi:predicted lactoylglutathione lyase
LHEDNSAPALPAKGGFSDAPPPQEIGFMYGRAVEDPEGDVLEFAWMDLSAASEMPTIESPARSDWRK